MRTMSLATWLAILSAADYFVKFSRRLGVVGRKAGPVGGGLA